jgi:hypothetical protein
MRFDIGEVFHIGALIVGVALAFTLVSSKNTSSIITATGNTFSGALRASMGH